ncbi:MAG: 30S ribosomal protein S4e [archaeon]
MTKAHLKRISAPKTWNVNRKTTKFITRPKPGAHTMILGMPLGVFFKEELKKAGTTREVKRILNNQEVLVDGKREYKPRSIIGLMDVLSLPKIKEHFRVLINTKDKLYAMPVDEKETKFKPCKLWKKKVLGKDKIQLNFTDGRNILIKKNDYTTGDSLVLELPSQKILHHLKLGKDAIIMLYKGKHVGMVGHVDEIKGSTIYFTADKVKYETSKAYAFVIGHDKPVIKIQK